MLELLLIRHGQTDWNKKLQIMGRQPIPLNRTGRKQIKKLAKYLRGSVIDLVYASPVERARETAEILTHHLKSDLIEEDALTEIDYGEWVNKSFQEVHEHYADAWRGYRENPERLSFPGGESLPAGKARVGVFVDRLLQRHQEGRVALVTHADIVKLVLLHIFELPLIFIKHFSIDNGAMVLVRFLPDTGPRLIHYNAMNGFGKDL